MKIKQVETRRSQSESKYKGSKKPEFKKGDYVRVYCGQAEGHHFWIDDVRFNANRDWFEYLYPPYGWYSEQSLVRGGDRRGWHYDSQGYCDNPGRGY